MDAAYIDRLGPADEIRHGRLPDPLPGPADVLVEVTATAVNHVDTFVRSGAWRTLLTFPFVIGRDLVGTVAATGERVSGFAPGDRVWSLSMGYAGRPGAAAERVAVPADHLHHLPAGADPVDAVALAHPAATAHAALFRCGRLRAGETVAVVGAGGNVGGAAVALAVDAGARVVAVASAHDADYCAKLGADAVVDRAAPDVHRRLARLCPDGVDVYVDAAGRNEVDHALGVLARRGRIVLLAGMRTRAVIPVGDLYLLDRTVTGFAISQASTGELARAVADLGPLIADGRLRPREVEVLPLEAAAEAHRAVETGRARGRRFVLRVGEGAGRT
ncbi:zinc-binding dehydrogenase [Nocardiopsis sp. NPDC057823]|uniref:zinc-binding dehydrogenase n=1 Tax=Nocardiopsis sp. NPDC057823 TaxID=3346256 RepID=UPI0036731B49